MITRRLNHRPGVKRAVAGCSPYIERFIRAYREEVLSVYLFDSLERVREITPVISREICIPDLLFSSARSHSG